MVAKTDLSKLNCSLARALGSVGDWWTLLIVRDAFFGATRFGEFQKSLGIARNILANRLESLVDAGILTREGTGARPRYLLTQKGREMLPALLALMQWGDKWESGGRPPMIAVDADGKTIPPVRLETETGKPVATVRFRAGPGATKRTRMFLEARMRDE
jgi:DNA-binding HxlR family transcriptional regulator